MKTANKLISVILGTTMLLSSVVFLSGCDKNSKEKITKDSTWYDNKTVDCKTGHEDEALDYSDYELTFAAGDMVYTVFTANRPVTEEELLSPDYDYTDYTFSELIQYDLDGNLISSTDITELLSQGTILSQAPSANGFTMVYSAFNPVTYAENYYSIEYNVSSNTFGEAQELNIEYDVMSGYLENIVLLKTGAILASVYTYNQAPSYILYILENGEIVKTIDFMNDFNETIYSMQTFIPDADGNLMCCGARKDTNVVYKLDINTYEVTAETDTGFDWYAYLAAADGNFYNIDEEGINKANLDTKENELVFSFQDCNVNLYKATSLNIMRVTDESVVLAGPVYSNSEHYGSASGFSICTLTKADSNPNAGKNRITIGLVDGYADVAVSEAIYQFNETSDKYFASVKTYNSFDNLSVAFLSKEDYQGQTLSAKATMTNDLSIELMSGDGPDIIMDAASLSQLNNTDYLKDISEYISKLDSASYFTNVIEASKTGNALYQLPISFITSGIACETQYAPSNGTGFTLPEYEEFVYGPCNGIDPIEAADRNEYFLQGITRMSNLFINSDTKTVDFCQDSFYDFAAYCLENVPKEIYYDESYYYMDSYWTSLDDLASYTDISAAGQKDVGFYGVSVDGRGPCIEVDSSVAISATTQYEDACYEFIDILISEDIQYLCSETRTNCININALKRSCADRIEYLNADYESLLTYGFSEAELTEFGIGKVDESITESYIACLSAADTLASIDPAVATIILEEIPAYFAGQKTIEEVAALINNRAQTVLDER